MLLSVHQYDRRSAANRRMLVEHGAEEPCRARRSWRHEGGHGVTKGNFHPLSIRSDPACSAMIDCAIANPSPARPVPL